MHSKASLPRSYFPLPSLILGSNAVLLLLLHHQSSALGEPLSLPSLANFLAILTRIFEATTTVLAHHGKHETQWRGRPCDWGELLPSHLAQINPRVP